MSLLENLIGGKTLSDATAAAEKAEAELAAAIAAASVKAGSPPSSRLDSVSYDGDFNPAAEHFDPDRAYRIHFKNGFSGEYSGAVLSHTFAFDPKEITRCEAV
jgi:hypothetical protein